MKKVLLILAVLGLFSFQASAQRFAYVDSELILKQIPEYASAERQVKSLTDQWQKQVDDRLAEVERMYKAYQTDRVMLTPQQRVDMEQQIVAREKAAKDFQRQKFGFEGELYVERMKLIKPIQDKVAQAVEAVAEANQLDVIFDKQGTQVMMLYSSPRLDKSNEVLQRLGIRVNTGR